MTVAARPLPPPDDRPPLHVVVVGAGLGGLTVARELADRPVKVTVVDRHNHHLFQPLLYQVATAGLEPQAVARSVRGIFRRAPNVHFRHAAAEHVDLDRREVRVDTGPPLHYDHLVLAAGATTKTLGIDGVREHTYPLKTLADATNLRDHVLAGFEQAAADPDAIEDGDLTFVMVGAGPTGVEMAGGIADLVHRTVAADYPEIDPARVRICVVEALPDVLPPYAPHLQAYAREALETRGVEVVTGRPLAGVDGDGVELDDGTHIPARTVVWAAGVRAHTLADTLGVEQAPDGSVVVEDDLTIPDHPEVHVIGDMCGALDPDGEPYPNLAPVAVQQGRHVVRQVARRRAGRASRPFRYDDHGTMTTIGPGAAVVSFPSGRSLTGRVAWIAWLGLHVAELIGFRNRVAVLLDWLTNYGTRDRAATLIVRGAGTPRRTPGEDVDAGAA